MNVTGKGLAVLTGCGHAGVVNICWYAGPPTGGQQLHGVIGGCRLNGAAYEPLIECFCADLGALGPSVVVPAHCTGWRAQHALARTFGEAFALNSVGTGLLL